MGDDSRKGGRPRFGRVFARATTNPFNLGVAGAGALAAAALASWPILALGGAAYAALVAFDSANPTFWKKTFAGGKQGPAELPAADRVADPSTRDAVTQLRAAREELAQVLAASAADLRAHLATVERTLDELERRAARLVARADELANYLATVDAGAVQAEADKLGARERAAADPQTRDQLASARAARQDQLRTLGELSRAKERLDANLSSVVAVVAGLPSKVVHMRTLDDQAMDDLSGDMKAELETMTTEMRTFEETLKTLVEVTP